MRNQSCPCEVGQHLVTRWASVRLNNPKKLSCVILCDYFLVYRFLIFVEFLKCFIYWWNAAAYCLEYELDLCTWNFEKLRLCSLWTQHAKKKKIMKLETWDFVPRGHSDSTQPTWFYSTGSFQTHVFMDSKVGNFSYFLLILTPKGCIQSYVIIRRLI